MAEVAEHYRKTVKAIRRWRERGIGPRAVRIDGVHLLYPRSEVERYDRQILSQLEESSR